MKKAAYWKRLLALGLAATIVLTDQTIVYGAEVTEPIEDISSQTLPDEPENYFEEEESITEESPGPANSGDPEESPDSENSEEPEETPGPANLEEPEENLDPANSEEPEEVPVSSNDTASDAAKDESETQETTEENIMQTVWIPQKWEGAYEEDKFSFDQPLIGRPEEEEPYTYDTSYGNQLTDALAIEFYQKLKEWENSKESFELSLGTLTTENEELAGEEYAAFCEVWQKAAQNAWDAYYFDSPKAGRLDVNKCGITVTFSGTELEDGGILWTADAVWNLAERDNLPDEDTWTGLALEASVEHIYEEVQKLLQNEIQEAETEENYEKVYSDEDYARIFQALCRQEEIECVLVPGIADEELCIWNMVRMEDGNWYAMDMVHGICLAGAGTEEEGFGVSHQLYGDFSNSHMGMFVLPELSENDYIEKAEEELISEAPVPDEALPEETEAVEAIDLFAVSEEVPQEASEETALPKEETAVAAASARAAAPTEKVLTGVSVSNVKVQTYSGKAITPKVTVKDTATKKKLKAGKQYTISYENNVNAGTATIVIRGIKSAGYDGVLRVNFSIQPQNVAKKVKAKVSGKFSYTGAPITPGVSLTYNKMGLRLGTDYQISYANNTAKGTAQIYITGMGNYSGTKTVKFKISARKMKEASVKLSAASTVYNGANAYPTVTVTYGGKTCQPNVDYKVKYPKKLKAGKNTITVTGLKSFSGSVKLTYYINKAPMEQAVVSLPYAWKYTKKNVKVIPSSVKVGGTTLTNKKDYTIKYRASNGKTSSGVKNEGTYQIILTGKGSFQGTKVLDFCITSDGYVLNNNYDSGAPKAEDTPPAADTVYPDNLVPAEKDKYFGYYEGNKITSKKGIQGTSKAYTEDLQVQHVLLNVDMASMISTTERSGYVPYTYKGKTYYFSDLVALKKTIYDLHGWGSTEGNQYGENHMRTVTLVLLMSWSDELSFLIHPSARKKGAAPYYALNMQDVNAKATFEALFRYMGEWLGQYKTRVSNWTLGNEVNSCREWNYSGSMSLSECVANYAQAFQLLYSGVTRTASSSRVFISLDHCWTASVAGHSGKDFLDQFAAYMNQTAPNMRWNVNYHPYSQPLSKRDFWNDNSNTTNAVSTKYISMKNIQVLTDYLSTLESKYGKSSGSIRVIIGELGYSAAQGNASAEKQQAAALGYGYYIAMFNRRIDSYIIRAYQDAAEEGSLYLGLRNKKDVKKESYDVYKYLDTNQSLNYMNQYLSSIGISSWESAIPGFNAGALPADF